MNEQEMQISITHHVQGQGGKYVAHIKDETHTGMLEWEQRHGPNGEDIHVATHTVVPKAIGGRGIAGMLVERLVTDAAKYGFRVEPQCTYVAKKFEDNPDWAEWRA